MKALTRSKMRLVEVFGKKNGEGAARALGVMVLIVVLFLLCSALTALAWKAGSLTGVFSPYNQGIGVLLSVMLTVFSVLAFFADGP